MFGVINLTQEENGSLTEKAGREGFRENRAYRQMRSILMNFFLQTAGDFFREDGRYADVHAEKRAELNRNEEIRRQQASKVRKKRSDFQGALTQVFSAIDDRRPEQLVTESIAETKRKAESVMAQRIPTQQKAIALMRVEKEGRDILRQLEKSWTVIKPRGVGLSRELSNEWQTYVSQSERLSSQLVEPAETEIEQFVSNLAKRSKIPLDDAARLTASISEYGNDANRAIRQLRADIIALLGDVANNVRETTRESFSRVTHTIDEVMVQLQGLQRSSVDIGSLATVRENLVAQITSVHEEERSRLERLRDQLSEVKRLWEEGAYDTAELTEALEEEIDELRARRDADLELAQVGLALNTVSHEFEKTVGMLRDGLRRLKAWADTNPDLRRLYRDIRDSFDHLDEYLTLFTPLDRRVHRSKIDISGKQIFEFLEKLFGPRLARHGVKLASTNRFLQSSVHSYPSSILPAFVNLVDNSIFWLQRKGGSREIKLDAVGKDLLVKDNGPGVNTRDRENIFLLNFSRKPGGRGMGLHISRGSLEKVGLRLTLDEKEDASDGATFRISAVNAAASK